MAGLVLNGKIRNNFWSNIFSKRLLTLSLEYLVIEKCSDYFYQNGKNSILGKYKNKLYCSCRELKVC